MPQTAFAHTGAGVKSSVLFLRKWSEKTTDKIENKKIEIEIQLKKEYDYENKVAEFETEKKRIIREHKGFENTTNETDKKAIEKTEDFIEWKKQISDTYNQKINDFKEEMEDKYLIEKQKQLEDYQIFMAIAEDIGYDATGKETGNNELNEIEKELKKFIINNVMEETV